MELHTHTVISRQFQQSHQHHIPCTKLTPAAFPEMRVCFGLLSDLSFTGFFFFFGRGGSKWVWMFLSIYWTFKCWNASSGGQQGFSILLVSWGFLYKYKHDNLLNCVWRFSQTDWHGIKPVAVGIFEQVPGSVSLGSSFLLLLLLFTLVPTFFPFSSWQSSYLRVPGKMM